MDDPFQVMTLEVRMLALVVSIIAAYVIIKQLQRVNQTVLGNAFSSTFAELRELHKVFIEHPDLWPYFYDNQPLTKETGGTDYPQARAVAEMFLDAFIHMYLLRSRFPENLRSHINLYIDDMVRLSEFLSDYLTENAALMPEDLRALVKSLVEKRETAAKRMHVD